MKNKKTANVLTHIFLRFVALNFNHRKALNRYLGWDGGPFDFTFGIKTENGSVEQALIFRNHKVTVSSTIPARTDATLIFKDENALKEAATEPPNKLMIALMENRMVTQGNIGCLQLINFYLSLLLKPIQILKLKQETKKKKGTTIRTKRQETASLHDLPFPN